METAKRLPDIRISLLPKPVVVVTSKSPEGIGATTVAWTGVISSRPPVISVSFLPDSFCRQRIVESREFVVNIPGISMIDQVEQLGAASGSLESKLDLSPGQLDDVIMDSAEILSPGLKGYLLNVECRVLQVLQIGLYDCFLGYILAIHGRADLVKNNGHIRGDIDFSTDPPIACLGDEYWSGGVYCGKSRENKNHPHGDRH